MDATRTKPTVFVSSTCLDLKQIREDVKEFLDSNYGFNTIPNLYLSAAVAQSISDEAQYIRNKGFDDQYYRDMIVGYIRQYGSAQKKDIKALLWDKLSDVLPEEKKNSKITTLLTSLRTKGVIKTDSPNQQRSRWVLTNDENSNKPKK